MRSQGFVSPGGRQNATINVHLVCHTHDDSGWLKTVDQYYYGANQTIQMAGVQYILDNVIESLLVNPTRRFTYAEMSFFTRWWNEQGDQRKAEVTKLVADGRLTFVNGGYVQHDEASSYYQAMIDQTTLGHRFLKKTFGVVPRIGWQIDPFGHSSTQAGLLSSQLGFDALFFGRADYQDMARRIDSKELELVWFGSGGGSAPGSAIFTGNFYSGNYCPPPGFNYDWGSPDPPIMDNPALSDYNVQERVEAFVEACRDYANHTVGNDIMLTMGSDFHYANAHVWYKNLDKLIRYVNEDGRVNVFYSSPEDYVTAKHDYSVRWPMKDDDFFPYADGPHAYWTGYFTSRPTSKGYFRSAGALLNAARQLEAFAGRSDDCMKSTAKLEDAVALAQHHDAITGTAKQHVANDYVKRITEGVASAANGMLTTLGNFIHIPQLTILKKHSMEVQRRRLQESRNATSFQLCPLLNASICSPTVKLSRQGQDMLVLVYNPVAWRRSAPVRVPVIASEEENVWSVEGPKGETVACQIVEVSDASRRLQDMMVDTGHVVDRYDAAADSELVFIAEDLPPVGYKVYTVQRSSRRGSSYVARSIRRCGSISNGVISLDVSSSSSLHKLTFGDAPPIDFRAVFKVYNSSDGLDSEESREQASGAYIFRPNGATSVESISVETVEGEVVNEAREVFAVKGEASYMTLTSRLYKDIPWVEVEWTVGPIPFEDGFGREIALQFQSSVQSGDVFYTDSNGRSMLKRVRNKRPTWDWNATEPIAGNYYPLTTGMYIEDERVQLSLLTDRAQGGTSLNSGDLEIMVHRRLLKDDLRGVEEPLNETMCGCTHCNCPGLVARGVVWLSLSEQPVTDTPRRIAQQLLSDPPILAFAAAGDINQRQELCGEFSLVDGVELPKNVHLLTLMETEDDTLIVRLAHTQGREEDGGQPAQVDLGELLKNFKWKTVSELSLSTNQKRSQAPLGRRLFNDLTEEKKPVLECLEDCRREKALLVELQPMEVKTFEFSR